ncbi:hypothetical protein [Halopiger xanaduensis]|uniref:Uncharacterized protein n=1 Tax=Halopiger xanaduensis (strain DSM 18323 / JCM 14033 / SH-6) TaxID=797210 RepID=F8DDX2_HALXS|nr:hypothetical protein [Halopiger xanaduensis]AEH39226.1 hypothetical protein Halxa_0645 [Halopiger xanaduensis SH-6]
MSTGRFAFDIETINPQLEAHQKPDFQNPEHFELFSLCCAYQPEPGANIEHEVFFRQGRDAASELDLIEETLEWFDVRDAESIITYNGEYFDFTQFEGRARVAADDLGDRHDVVDQVESFLASIGSDDLKEDSWDCFGDYTRFEETCEYCGIEPPRTMLSEFDVDTSDYPEHRSTTDAMKRYFVGRDVPVVGEKYLDLLEVGATETKTFCELHRMLEHYAATDVVPLFELADERPFDRYV